MDETSIRCFLLEPSVWVRDTLRRYSGTHLPNGDDNPDRTCPLMPGAYSYHNADVPIGDREEPDDKCYALHSREDRRWPRHCACGYEFMEWDEWQYNAHRLYERQDTKDLLPLHETSAGAMWYAEWMTEHHQGRPGDLYHGPDNRCLVVVTPGGEWLIDGPATTSEKSKPGWQRVGTPPNTTATPSIMIGKYHGWLREGYLVEA